MNIDRIFCYVIFGGYSSRSFIVWTRKLSLVVLRALQIAYLICMLLYLRRYKFWSYLCIMSGIIYRGPCSLFLHGGGVSLHMSRLTIILWHGRIFFSMMACDIICMCLVYASSRPSACVHMLHIVRCFLMGACVCHVLNIFYSMHYLMFCYYNTAVCPILRIILSSLLECAYYMLTSSNLNPWHLQRQWDHRP